MLRKLVVILTMLLCSMATQLYALGLGAVTVESTLNQPLRVRIELLQLGDTRLQDVRVQMASTDDFQRLEIERVSFLSNVRFSVESGPQGNVVILTTNQVVREPYLSFVLDTRWPSGRLLSKHTILLDLPVFNDQRSVTELRQPISPILQQPSGNQPATQPFVEAATTPTLVTPSSTSSAANIQPEQIAPAANDEVEPEPEPESEPANVQPEATEPELETVNPVEDADEVAVVEENIPEEVDEAEPEPEAAIVEEAEPESEVAVVEEAAPEVGVAQEQPEVAVEEVEPEVAVDETVEAVDAAAEPEEPAGIETGDSDTLSDIALRVRPDNSVSMQQTMLAIQQLNPDAFADGNINRLRSGQVLRVPTLAEIEAIDPRDAVEDVARQNQDFAAIDVQPLAAPADAQDTQEDEPQGQLSVVSSDDTIDVSAESTQLGNAENEALDQRIAELETQLAQRQEEADRARIEREELDSRMQDLEAQIAAAQEIIRLQDIQLAQLQDSLAAAAAEAQLLAEQQAIQAAAEAEAAQPVASPSSFFDDVLRILTGNSVFMIFGVVLVILLLVVLMLRRNRAAKLGEDDIDEIAEQEFGSSNDEALTEDSERDESETEFQDYDSADLDSELDDIIEVADDGEDSDALDVDEEEYTAGEEDHLDVLARADEFLEDNQFERALSMLTTSLQQQGDNPDVRDKIEEVEAAEKEFIAAEQLKAETTRAREAASRESETKSFLDDLGIDLDSFDYDEESADEASSESDSATADSAVDAEEVTANLEPDDMDLTFDLGGGDEPINEDVVSEESADDSAAVVTEQGGDDDEPASFDFDLDDDQSNALQGESSDPEDLEIDTLEFDVEAPVDTASDTPVEEEDLDLETFSFDAEPASVSDEAVEVEADDSELDVDENAVEFAFDKTEITEDKSDKGQEQDEELETFDFDLDDDTGDTVLEKPSEESESLDDNEVSADDFDFDLDEFDAEPVAETKTASSPADEDDFLSFDDGEDETVANERAVVPDTTEENSVLDEEIEFDLDDEIEQDADAGSGDESSDVDDLVDDDDLGFLSDDEVEIESVDDIEEVELLSDDDETATKLELAYAYQKMGDIEGAREILQEVIKEGSHEQVAEAGKLLLTLDDNAK